MNRNLDGTLLTNEQLIAMCEEIGVDTKPILGTHNKGLIRSGLLDATQRHRFERTDLVLDTRTPANTPGYTFTEEG